MLEERLLERVKAGVLAQALDGEHPLAGDLGDGNRARSDGIFIHNYGAGAAQGGAAAELGAGEAEVVAQHPQQHALVVDRHAHRLAVERE